MAGLKKQITELGSVHAQINYFQQSSEPLLKKACFIFLADELGSLKLFCHCLFSPAIESIGVNGLQQPLNPAWQTQVPVGVPAPWGLWPAS